MIAVFGGTTEGLAVAEMLDLLQETYIYSTKTKTRQKVAGVMRFGALDEIDLLNFCTTNAVTLLIDAAHPFAIQLHRTIASVAKKLAIVTIRYERRYPDLSHPLIHCFPDYNTLITSALADKKITSLLALTGVQTIKPLQPLWDIIPTKFRILDTPTSLAIADESGIGRSNIIQAAPQIEFESLLKLAMSVSATILITKESGESGYFSTKLKVAEALDIPLWVVQRPELPSYDVTLYSQKELCQTIIKMRKDHLRKSDELRSGLTSGTCVTAAAVAAFSAIFEDEFPRYSEVNMPDGKTELLPIFDGRLTVNSASCLVIKDAGDDPDVMHGAEIGCEVRLISQQGMTFKRGIGIGTVTLSGLQVAVGEPAINDTPKQMITAHLEYLMQQYGYIGGVEVTPFIPNGEALAKRTFNSRVGVVGGLSIIGTSGRVKPYSVEAFSEAIRRQVGVVAQLSRSKVVATSGKRSEEILKRYEEVLPQQSYIHFGNNIGVTLDACCQTGINEVTLGVMFGKAIKLAEGHLDTHSRVVQFNPVFAATIASELGYSEMIVNSILKLTLANAITEFIPFSVDEPFYKKIANLCFETCLSFVNNGCNLTFYLISSTGDIIMVERIVA